MYMCVYLNVFDAENYQETFCNLDCNLYLSE